MRYLLPWEKEMWGTQKVHLRKPLLPYDEYQYVCVIHEVNRQDKLVYVYGLRVGKNGMGDSLEKAKANMDARFGREGFEFFDERNEEEIEVLRVLG